MDAASSLHLVRRDPHSPSPATNRDSSLAFVLCDNADKNKVGCLVVGVRLGWAKLNLKFIIKLTCLPTCLQFSCSHAYNLHAYTCLVAVLHDIVATYMLTTYMIAASLHACNLHAYNLHFQHRAVQAQLPCAWAYTHATTVVRLLAGQPGQPPIPPPHGPQQPTEHLKLQRLAIRDDDTSNPLAVLVQGLQAMWQPNLDHDSWRAVGRGG